jgi:hypothetical protein
MSRFYQRTIRVHERRAQVHQTKVGATHGCSDAQANCWRWRWRWWLTYGLSHEGTYSTNE